jgi:hypothetical protein
MIYLPILFKYHEYDSRDAPLLSYVIHSLCIHIFKPIYFNAHPGLEHKEYTHCSIPKIC